MNLRNVVSAFGMYRVTGLCTKTWKSSCASGFSGGSFNYTEVKMKPWVSLQWKIIRLKRCENEAEFLASVEDFTVSFPTIYSVLHHSHAFTHSCSHTNLIYIKKSPVQCTLRLRNFTWKSIRDYTFQIYKCYFMFQIYGTKFNASTQVLLMKFLTIN